MTCSNNNGFWINFSPLYSGVLFFPPRNLFCLSLAERIRNHKLQLQYVNLSKLLCEMNNNAKNTKSERPMERVVANRGAPLSLSLASGSDTFRE